MKKSIFFFITLFLPFYNISAQCTIDNNTSTGDFKKLNLEAGQSFLSCQSGELTSLTFYTNENNDANTVEIIPGVSCDENNSIATASFSGSGQQTVTFSPAPSLVNGNTYTFLLRGGDPWVEYSTGNTYSDGNLLEHYLCNSNSDQDMRFSLTISEAMPVELTQFEGHRKQSIIELRWRTASELSNHGFEIEKSSNGRDWYIIDFVEGRGTTYEINEYQYQDLNPFTGINYYRLKQIDFDGAFKFSNVIVIEYNKSEKHIQVFPNPSNKLINIKIDDPSRQRIKITISDNLGRKVWESELIEEESNWEKRMEIKENGIYIISALIGDEIHYERVVITDEK